MESGTYVSPAKGSAVWKQRYEELYEALTKTGLVKPEQMPWVDVRYVSNAFFTSRFTGRYLWLKLVALAKIKFLKLHMHENLAEGFFGIVKIEVPKASIKTFNESPMQSREVFFAESLAPLSSKEGAAAEQQRKKRAVKDRKTLEKCWRTFGLMEVRQSDGSLEFTFDKGVAESINKQNANGRKKAEKVEEEEEASALGTSSSAEEEATESAIPPEAKAGAEGGDVFEALDMLASISTKDL